MPKRDYWGRKAPKMTDEQKAALAWSREQIAENLYNSSPTQARLQRKEAAALKLSQTLAALSPEGRERYMHLRAQRKAVQQRYAQTPAGKEAQARATSSYRARQARKGEAEHCTKMARAWAEEAIKRHNAGDMAGAEEAARWAEHWAAGATQGVPGAS